MSELVEPLLRRSLGVKLFRNTKNRLRLRGAFGFKYFRCFNLRGFAFGALRRVAWEARGSRKLTLLNEAGASCSISRVAGIEPTHTVLKTVVLPLNYTPVVLNRA